MTHHGFKEEGFREILEGWKTWQDWELSSKISCMVHKVITFSWHGCPREWFGSIGGYQWSRNVYTPLHTVTFSWLWLSHFLMCCHLRPPLQCPHSVTFLCFALGHLPFLSESPLYVKVVKDLVISCSTSGKLLFVPWSCKCANPWCSDEVAGSGSSQEKMREDDSEGWPTKRRRKDIGGYHVLDETGAQLLAKCSFPAFLLNIQGGVF